MREEDQVISGGFIPRYEHILMEPDPVPAYALKLLVAMTEHNAAFTRYGRPALQLPRGTLQVPCIVLSSLTLSWPELMCSNPLSLYHTEWVTLQSDEAGTWGEGSEDLS